MARHPCRGGGCAASPAIATPSAHSQSRVERLATEFRAPTLAAARRRWLARARPQSTDAGVHDPHECCRMVPQEAQRPSQRPASTTWDAQIALHLVHQAAAEISLDDPESRPPCLFGCLVLSNILPLRSANRHCCLQHAAEVRAHVGAVLSILEDDLMMTTDRETACNSDVELVVGRSASGRVERVARCRIPSDGTSPLRESKCNSSGEARCTDRDRRVAAAERRPASRLRRSGARARSRTPNQDARQGIQLQSPRRAAAAGRRHRGRSGNPRRSHEARFSGQPLHPGCAARYSEPPRTSAQQRPCCPSIRRRRR